MKPENFEAQIWSNVEPVVNKCVLGGSKVPALTYVVVVNWNGKEILKKCLTSFFANTSNPDCKVVVVDNASTDGSVETVQETFFHKLNSSEMFRT